MRIKISNKSLKSLPRAYARVSFVEDGAGQLVKQGNLLTLEVVSGKLLKLTPRTFRTFMRNVVQSAKRHKLGKLALELTYADFPGCAQYGEEWFWSAVAENMLLAEYEYHTYKSKKPKRTLTEVLLVTKAGKVARDGVGRGTLLGASANFARDIANTPGGDMTPAILALRAKEALKGTKATVTIHDKKEIEKLKMGGLLGVSKGAHEEPKFIVIEYKGSDEKPIVFVGKGITFDTGGLQVKPGMAMYEMHMDMSGGAAVIAAIAAIAKLGLKKHVIGLIPACENSISDRAIRPGDVLTMMSGQTVDVLHTDAEGRLILADALHYAKRYKPRLVVDVATLTGAALVAVGQHAHIIMTKDRGLEDTLRELGEESGDYVFPLPLWDEFKQYTKGVHGDISNIPPGDSKYGGSINGGMFLSHFTKGLKWVHIDMAPRMTSVSSDKLAKGSTGEPTRLLVTIAEKYS